MARPSKYPESVKAAALKEFRESELNDIEICRKYDIKIGTFKWWCYADPELHQLLRIRMRTHLKKHMYTAEERVAAIEAFNKSGLSVSAFAKVYGVSLGTLNSWKNIYEEHGPEGLSTVPIRNFVRGKKPISDGLKEEITKVKTENPTFGLRKIRDFLMRFKGVKVSHKTVGKTLKENGIPLLEGPKKRRRKEKIRRFERARPMQLWQSDITSYMLTRHARRVYLTVFMDDHSRYIVAWNLQLRQTNDLVMDCLLNGIQKFGKPEEVLTDQGRQYFAWRGKSDFKKLLDKEGIRHVVSRSHHPQTLGKCERFWETVKTELWERAKPQELGEAKERMKHFVNHYNHFRPHQGLDGMTPADRFFGVENEIRKKLEETIKDNELRLALGELPRMPVFLVGQIGDKSISLHGEDGQLVINTPDGETKSVDFEKFGHIRMEKINGASRKGAETKREKEGNIYEASEDSDTGKEPVAECIGGGASEGAACGYESDGVLVRKDNEEAVIREDQPSAGEDLAVVTASNLWNASGITEATESAIEGSSFDSRRRSAETETKDIGAGETHSDAGSIDSDLARDAGLQGCKDTNGAESESGREDTWSSKEKQDTDGSSS